MSSTTWTQEAGMTGDIDSDNVQDLVDQAEDSKDAAAASETAAATSATSAAASATNAANSSASSASSASDASTSETNAATSATSAASSATSSASSASAASTSESNAAASASAAAASESAAGTSETNAATSATNAASSASDASGSAGDASTSAAAAATSASAAAASESAAASSESAASTSETNAANSATSASTSATNAANSETNASTSATNAATSETNAATSASNAATSATAASTSATAAQAAQAAAEAAQEAIDGTYLGALASDPTVDGNGDAVTTGDWYYNTADSQAYIYNGSSWDALAPDLVGDATPQLGGDLDTNGNAIKWLDNNYAYFGTGGATDMKIWYNGSNGHIEVVNGALSLEGGGSTLITNSGSNIISTQGDSAHLHYAGATKLATTSTGVDVTGVITTDGLTTSANVNFGDNDKAIFGTGTDLEIWHNGADTYIRNQTGHLILRNEADDKVVSLQTDDGSGGYVNYVQCDGNTGATNLYYDGVKRLATTSSGIDVTGTVTADGLTVDGSSTFDDIKLTAVALPAAGNPSIALRNTDNNIYIQSGSGNAFSFLDSSQNTLYNVSPTAHIFNISNSEKMRIDSSGQVLIGTSVDHSSQLTVGATGGAKFVLAGNGNIGSDVNKIEFRDRHTATYPEGQLGSYIYGHRNSTSAQHYLTFGTVDGEGDASERMRIDSSGNVGIGTTSPVRQIHSHQSSGGSTNYALFTNTTTGSTSSDGIIVGLNATSDGYLWNYEAGNLVFGTSATERMRIDSSGYLKFDSGYGSAATAYGCRSWCNFDSTGTIAIRDSGNVSSITDGGTGVTRVNFTNAMPDANYAVTASCEGSGSFERVIPYSLTTTGFYLYQTSGTSGTQDMNYVWAMVVR